MFLARRVGRIARQFVTVNIKPIKQPEKKKLTWEELMFTSNMTTEFNIPRILKAEPKIQSLVKQIQYISSTEEWYITDMLKLMALCAKEGYFSGVLMEELHRFLVNHSNYSELLEPEIFYSLSQFLDIKSNIPYLKNGRMQAYSRLYNKLNPFQRQIVLRDYLIAFKTGDFVNSYVENIDKEVPEFKLPELPQRNTQFQYTFIQLKNRMMLQNVVEGNYWTDKRLQEFEKLLNQYLSMLEDTDNLAKLVRQYQSTELFLSDLTSIPIRPQLIEQYKERLVKILTKMYDPENYGLLLPKDENIESIIMSNFSRNDRLILKPLLQSICDLFVNRHPIIKVETLILMEYCNFLHAELLHCAFKSIHNKMKGMRNVGKHVSFKPYREILSTCVLLEKLRYKKVLKNLVPKIKLLDFSDLFLSALRSFIFSEKNGIDVDQITYKNLMLEYLNPGKYNSTRLESVSRISDASLKLINSEKSLNIQMIHDYVFDFRFDHQRPALGIFILQLQSFQALLLMYQEDERMGFAAIKQIASNIVQMKTFLNYVCLPRVYDTFIRIKRLIKKNFKNFDWNLIDAQTSNRIRMQYNDIWNTLDSLSQKYKKSFLPDQRYHEYLFDIEPGFVQPLLGFGKSSTIIHNGNNINFQSNFVCNEQNIIQNINTNKLLPLMYQESKLKDIIESALKQSRIRYQKNYVDYPFFADYLIEGTKKTVIYSVDYTKLFMGTSNVTVKSYDESVEFFKDLNYNVISITYNDLVNGKLKEEVLDNILKVK